MNPILYAALGSILRYLLMIAATYLGRKGIWTDAAAERYAEAATAALLAIGLSWWKIHGQRVKVVTALAMPQGSTESDLNAQVATKATPSVLTPVNTPPEIPAQPPK
jgi:hypothetical protein